MYRSVGIALLLGFSAWVIARFVIVAGVMAYFFVNHIEISLRRRHNRSAADGKVTRSMNEKEGRHVFIAYRRH